MSISSLFSSYRVWGRCLLGGSIVGGMLDGSDHQLSQDLLHSEKGHRGYVSAAAFSPGGQQCALGTWLKEVSVWKKEGDVWKKSDTFTHSGQVTALAFTPDEQQLLLGDGTGVITLLSLTQKGKGKQLEKIHGGAVNCLVFSNDGTRLISGGGPEKEICMWRWDGKAFWFSRVFHCYTGEVNALAITTNKDHVILGSSSAAVDSWSRKAKTGGTYAGKKEDQPEEEWVHNTIGQSYLSLSSTIRRPCSSGHMYYNIPWEDARELHTEAVTAVAISPDDATVASASEDKSVHLWDLQTRQFYYTLEAHVHPVVALCYRPDQLMMQGVIAYYARYHATQYIPTEIQQRIAHYWSRTHLLSLSQDGILKIWDPENGQLWKEVPCGQQQSMKITAVDLSKQGWFVFGYGDGTLSFWQPKIMRKLGI